MKKTKHFELISRVLHWLSENHRLQPSLGRIASEFGLSEFHLQRTFQDYVGVSPKQFVKYLGKEEAMYRLKSGQTVFETALDLGLSGPSRLHDLLVTTESITPGQIRLAGKGVELHYGYGMTPFGKALVAWTFRGINFLGFCHHVNSQSVFDQFRVQWPGLMPLENSEEAEIMVERIFSTTNGVPTKVWLRGSPFQLKVWEALLQIPPSKHCSYKQLATLIGQPNASRAVGSAISKNPIAWLIPCHRVITSIGTLGGYRWGTPTKKLMLAFEKSQRTRMTAPELSLANKMNSLA